jgi:hypothetical protein
VWVLLWVVLHMWDSQSLDVAHEEALIHAPVEDD